MANIIVAGALYESITGQLFELGRQLRQPNGYPFDAETLKVHLQAAIEGRFNGEEFLRPTGEFSIEIPALPRPTLEQLQAKYSWIKKIDRDISPTGPITLTLATVLGANENSSINGKEYERRLQPSVSRLLGYQHWEWLMEHQNEYPAFMALLGKIYIDFPGIVVVDDDGDRHVPDGSLHGKRWDADWDWLSAAFDQYGRVAVSGK